MNASSTSCTVPYLTSGSQYRCRVTARNRIGAGQPGLSQPVTMRSMQDGTYCRIEVTIIVTLVLCTNTLYPCVIELDTPIKPAKVSRLESSPTPIKPAFRKPDVIALVRDMLRDSELVKPVRLPVQKSSPPRRKVRTAKERKPTLPTRVILALKPVIERLERPVLLVKPVAIPPPPPPLKRAPLIHLEPNYPFHVSDEEETASAAVQVPHSVGVLPHSLGTRDPGPHSTSQSSATSACQEIARLDRAVQKAGYCRGR